MTFQAFSSLMPVRKRPQKNREPCFSPWFLKARLQAQPSQGSHLTLPQTQGATHVLQGHSPGRGLDPRSILSLPPHLQAFSYSTSTPGCLPCWVSGWSSKGDQWGRWGEGAEQEAWQQGKTHASLQESWLKRQVKMNLPSTSSSSEGEVSCLRLDRMLM